MITYIYLSNEDKARFKKLATSKQLSISTCTNILIKWLFCTINQNQYYNKGQNKICIKIRNEYKNPVTTISASNCVYAFLHNEVINNLSPTFWKNIKRKIQSDMDTTFDENWNKNHEMRINYKAFQEYMKGRA